MSLIYTLPAVTAPCYRQKNYLKIANNKKQQKQAKVIIINGKNVAAIFAHAQAADKKLLSL